MPAVTLTPEQLKAIVAEAVAPLEAKVHRLTAVVNAKLATPVETLTVKQAAARVKKCPTTVRNWIKLGILSERRGGRGKGADHLVLADELDVFITDGPEAVKRYRERLGRG